MYDKFRLGLWFGFLDGIYRLEKGSINVRERENKGERDGGEREAWFVWGKKNGGS